MDRCLLRISRRCYHKRRFAERKENGMKAEKMIVEIERTGNQRQGSRLSAYRDKLREACKDAAPEEGKTGDIDEQGRE